MNKHIILFIYYMFGLTYFSMLIDLLLTNILPISLAKDLLHYPNFIIINLFAFIFSEILKFSLNKFFHGPFKFD